MRILYVEDNVNDADLTTRRLSKIAPTFRLEGVASITDALARLDRLEEEPLDLVLTDVQLPDGGGISLLTHIRQRELPLAVVVITGAGDAENPVAALKVGADDYVIKHGDYLESLPLILESALEHYRADAARRARPFGVLYAEHDATDADLTRRHFARYAAHIQLEVVPTGSAAILRLQQHNGKGRPVALLLDYNLPGLNGLETLRQLRLTHLDLPVVLVTGQGDEEVALQTLKLGAASYVVKNPGYLYKLPGELENALSRAELLQREDALRQNQERYRLATTAGAVGVWDLNLQTGEMYVDPLLKHILGYQDHEIGSQLDDWNGLVHPDDAARARELVRAHIAGETPNYEVEHRVLHRDGSVRWFLVRGVAVKDPNGKAVRTVGTVVDVTVRKELEENLRHREREFATLVENSPDIISRVDRSLRFIYISPAVERVLGIPAGEFLGKTSREVGAPAHDWAGFDGACLQAFRTGKTVDREFSYRSRHYQTRVIPELGAGGSIDSVMGITQDITERKHFEGELQRLSGRLLDLQDEERRRIARELHDVTAQNLFAISINLAHMQQSKTRGFSETLTECQKLCEQSLQEIRTLSYLLHPPMLDQVGLVAALQWYIDGFSKRSGIDVALVPAQEISRLPVQVETDLFRIVQEGLANIHRHSGSATATIRLQRQTSCVVLQIEDQGCGMPAGVALAEPQGVGSLGVGVPGMRQRLRQLGGWLEIESGPRGTTVTATVPLAAEGTVRRAAGQGANYQF